eukprot:CAMPEP_0194312848 /NCGR_PEP_ID=MMETSP0171-20130528/9771_1 /TAXON_ID=218684 /ORGANISM="Corethron pennatum, Strain L29A3" /LENGTH=625 /DNA_ID=CAMNT_0039067551 /DNA_START=353 /DNA_END=2230 /DNA_ORIENTATION=-
MTYVGIYAMNKGNIYDLLQQKDYKGRLCGTDEDENGKVLPEFLAIVDLGLNRKCVASCPSVTDKEILICKDQATIANLWGCPQNSPPHASDYDLLVMCGACFYSLDSIEIVKYCTPKNGPVVRDLIKTLVDKYKPATSANTTSANPDYGYLDTSGQAFAYAENFVKDLFTASRAVFGIGVGGAFLSGFLFLFVIRIPGVMGIFIWTSAISIPTIFAALGYAFFTLELETAVLEGDALFDEDLDEIGKYSKPISYVFFGCAGLALLLLLFLRKRIGLAIGITKAAAHSVAAVPLSVLYPIFQILGFCTFMLPWTFYLLHLASMGKRVDQKLSFFDNDQFEVTYPTLQYDQITQYGFWYLLFCLFWSSQFIIAIGEIVLAMCYSKWYFTVDKSGRIDTSIFSATRITLCYHAGTAAFGSLIIAIIQMIRAIVTYVQKKIQEAGPASQVANAVACCFQCCLVCLERCMRFINKNAYIQTAIFGHNFCKGAKEAFFLIFRNAVRMAVVGLVSEMTMIVCKLVIVLLCSLSAFLTINHFYPDVTSVELLCIFVAFLSWFIADMFTDVLGMAVSTILQCFIADEEMFSGTGSHYVPKELDDFLKKVDAGNATQRAATAVPVSDPEVSPLIN